MTKGSKMMKRRALVSIALSMVAVCAGMALLAASSVAAGSLPTLTLAVTKNAIKVGGSLTSGAVNIAATVTGEPEDNPGMVLLKPGVTPAEFGKVVSKLNQNDFDAIDAYATIVYDAQNAVEGKTTDTEAVMPPGTYVALNNGNGYTVFTIHPSTSPASLPKPGGTVTAIDFRFRGADTLRDGELVRLQNDGYLIHMFIFAQVKSTADATKAEALLLKGKAKEATKLYGTGLTGTFAGPLSHGVMQQEVITEPPGVYVIACAMTAEDGIPHFEIGMFRTIHIVK
jgi:hypothetical protein